MGWDNDFEVSDEEIVIELGYKDMIKNYKEDVEKLGVRKAIENVVEHAEVLEQVNSAVGTPYFLDECDNAFVILMNVCIVIKSIAYWPQEIIKYDDFDSDNQKHIRTEWGAGCIEDIILKSCNELKLRIKEKEKRIEMWEKEMYSTTDDVLDADYYQECISEEEEGLEEYGIVLNYRGNKSVYEIIFRELEALTTLYCEEKGKRMESMRKYICIIVYDGLDIWEQHNVKIGFLSHMRKYFFKNMFLSLPTLREKLNGPYTYYLDSID